MKLADLNDVNNIRLGYSRPDTSGGFSHKSSAAVPISYKQSQKSKVDDEDVEDENEDNVDDEKSKLRLIDLISMANSWSPSRNTPDIRKTPNTANLI